MKEYKLIRIVKEEFWIRGKSKKDAVVDFNKSSLGPHTVTVIKETIKLIK